MTTCTHHWRQTLGDIHAPLSCIRCGEAKVMETDFYKLFEARTGRPWDRSNEQSAGSIIGT